MMRPLVLAIATLAAALVQAAAAPLFTLEAAAPAVVLVFLGLVALYRGETTAMVMTPFVAIAEGWSRGFSPGLLLVSYVPLVPLLGAIEQGNHPIIGPGARLTAAVTLTGAWARLVAATTVFISGADFAPTQLLVHLLVPGIAADVLLAAAAYGVLRLAAGEPGRRGLGWR